MYSKVNWFVEITSLFFDLNYKFELTGASLIALAKSIYYLYSTKAPHVALQLLPSINFFPLVLLLKPEVGSLSNDENGKKAIS